MSDLTNFHPHNFKSREPLNSYINQNGKFSGVLIDIYNQHTTRNTDYSVGVFSSIYCLSWHNIQLDHINIILPYRNHGYMLNQRYTFTATVNRYYRPHQIQLDDHSKSIISKITYGLVNIKKLRPDHKQRLTDTLSVYQIKQINIIKHQYNTSIKRINRDLRNLPDDGSREAYLKQYVTYHRQPTLEQELLYKQNH